MYDPFIDELQFVERNFSYDIVNHSVFIKYNQQMIVRDRLYIENILIIEGRLILEV